MIASFLLACVGLAILMWSSDMFVGWCREIAIRLAISESRVASLIHQARTKLRRRFVS